MAAMTATAAISELRPPHCKDQQNCIHPHKLQLTFLFISLALISIGAGGIRPCNIAFGADQFDNKTDKGKAQLETFFNLWYLSFTVALILALVVVVYIQTNISWLIGFAIPTACLVISITIFLIGRHTYICSSPQGTMFKDMAKVIVSSIRKRKVSLKSPSDHSYYDPDNARKSIKIDQFKCLDKAAVVTDPSELDPQGKPVNTWRLCSIQQVEDLRSVIRVLPVWVAGVGCFLVMDQQSTFGVLQALQMNRSIGKHFTIPPAWMGITSMIALSIWILIYEKIYIPISKKILKNPTRLHMKQRISIGMIMSIVCMIVAGFVEVKRRSLALKRGLFDSPLHVTALLPQFMLSGLTEANAAVALMEFFTMELPESMRSVAGAIFFLSLSVASYLSSLIVNVMHSVTGKGGDPWIGDSDLNHNKLHYYYFMIAFVGVIDLMYFIFFASKFVVGSGNDGEVELRELHE